MNTPNTPTNVDLPLRLLVQFQQRYPDKQPAFVLQAPGRDLWVMANLTDNARIILDSVELNARAQFTLHSAQHKRTVLHRPLPRWARYAAGVLVQLDEQGLSVSGLAAVVGGDEPSGPRYEYTLGILMAALLHTISGTPVTNARLFDITDRARRDYVEAQP